MAGSEFQTEGEFQTEIHVAMDHAGDPIVFVTIGDGSMVPFTAHDAEQLGVLMVNAAAAAKARAELFRDLTMRKGWSPDRAMEFLPKG